MIIEYLNLNNILLIIVLCEDSGWKHITCSKSSGNQYFKKISHNSDNDIFSDSISKASRYKIKSNICLTMFLSFFQYYVQLLIPVL